ncbi:hypothetical protein Tsubulata_006039 [Turnera subulata]|uniref:Ricin B lectin domain-containing protein n=1 Tax=Turnera subulata TaxID=218843 RepID=A0A9Q0GCS2_9ROSI|nr:hypothetical protein Tsubulata_006039 [Turnera subulata]
MKRNIIDHHLQREMKMIMKLWSVCVCLMLVVGYSGAVRVGPSSGKSSTDDNGLVIRPIINGSLILSETQQHPVRDERTTRIAGPNNICMEVKNGDYHDGHDIVLSPCEPDSSDPKQLWTFKADGTIRSQIRQMVLDSLLRQLSQHTINYLMIFSCMPPTDPRWAKTIWELQRDGTMVNFGNGLVLTARSDFRNGSR